MPKYYNPNNETLMLYNERGGDLWVAPLKERTKAREAAGHKFILEGPASHFDRFVKARQLSELVEPGQQATPSPIASTPLKAPMGALAAEAVLANKAPAQEAPKAETQAEKPAEKTAEKPEEQKNKFWDKKQQKH